MKKHRLYPPTNGPEPDDTDIPDKEPAAAPSVGRLSLLDVCRCPKCDGPMSARNGRNGPYFHCLCYEMPSPAARIAPKPRKESAA
jgi:hypothetical protein